MRSLRIEDLEVCDDGEPRSLTKEDTALFGDDPITAPN